MNLCFENRPLAGFENLVSENRKTGKTMLVS